MREYNFDGLLGPTHNYGGLSAGNIASHAHGGEVSNPREGALQGLEKMKFVAGLGLGQAVLPPHPRPSLSVLRALGFSGSDEEVLAKASSNEQLLRLCSSAAAVWTANAATVAPSSDAKDGRAHFVPANLNQMFHRAIEAPVTQRILSSIFSNPKHFCVHAPLPGGGQFADEGAANHTRLSVDGRAALHLFAWGRQAFTPGLAPKKYPARQTLEASLALARLLELEDGCCLFPQQSPEGIDSGAFHTDVLAVGNQRHLLLHEKAFVEPEALLKSCANRLGDTFSYTLATEAELPVASAVQAYPFNSQLVTLPSGDMALIAPTDSRDEPSARRFLERVLSEDNPVRHLHHLDVRQSMKNGGGPACLRLRVWLTDEERAHVAADVFYSEALHEALRHLIETHYRDRLAASDLRDVQLARESMAALDALTQVLKLGSIYDFQRAGAGG